MYSTSFITHTLHVWWGFYFLFLDLQSFNHVSFILFFILRRNCISTWLLMWERNVGVEKKKKNSLVIKNGTFVGKKKAVYLFILNLAKN